VLSNKPEMIIVRCP